MAIVKNKQVKAETIDASRRALFMGEPLVQSTPEIFDDSVETTASISQSCLAHKGVACQVCGDICEARAIKFHWTERRILSPQILPEMCTGCAECLPSCPVDAISLIEKVDQEQAVKSVR